MMNLRKVEFAFISVFLVTVYCLYSISLGYCIPDNGYFDVPYSSNIPNIDGQWSTPTEWTDASETRIENEFGWVSFFRLKHNQTHIFVLLDFITDQTDNPNDIAGICFDTRDDGGNFPSTDDYYFGIEGSSFLAFQGTGYGGRPSESWTKITVTSGTSARVRFSRTNDPYEEGKDHRIYEFQVSCQVLGESDRYGFYAIVGDASSQTVLEWPEDETTFPPVPAPGTWGSIGDHFIPEFPSALILPIFMIATLLAVMAYSRKRTK